LANGAFRLSVGGRLAIWVAHPGRPSSGRPCRDRTPKPSPDLPLEHYELRSDLSRLRRRRGSLYYKHTGSLADVAELLGDSKRVAADHYV
jgi:hypothetical protein